MKTILLQKIKKNYQRRSIPVKHSPFFFLINKHKSHLVHSYLINLIKLIDTK